LANGCPHNVEELMEDVICSIERIRQSPAKLRSCVKKSELPRFLARTIAFFMLVSGLRPGGPSGRQINITVPSGGQRATGR
jgi:hypothetical protein